MEIPEMKDIDRGKSIILMGPYGIGKTIAFRIIHRMLELRYPDPSERVNTFRETSMEEIINAMRSDDYLDGTLFYGIETVDGIRLRKPLNILINEFGVEYSGKHYGTPIHELIDQFLMKRYEIFQVNKKLTHATMNFNADELKSKFDKRLIDRFREMFNFIPMKGESFRK